MHTDCSVHTWFEFMQQVKQGPSHVHVCFRVQRMQTDYHSTAVAVNFPAAAFAWKAKWLLGKSRYSPCGWAAHCSLTPYYPVSELQCSHRKKRSKTDFTVSNIIRYVIIFLCLSLCVSMQSTDRDTHTSPAVPLPTWRLSTADGMSALSRTSPSQEISAYSTLTKSKMKNFLIINIFLCFQGNHGKRRSL